MMLVSEGTLTTMQRYCASIRNAKKRNYACAYAEHLIYDGAPKPEPEDLTVMAAQAVRMRLHEIAGY